MSLIPSIGIAEVFILGGIAGMVSLIVAIVVMVIVKSQRGIMTSNHIRLLLTILLASLVQVACVGRLTPMPAPTPTPIPLPSVAPTMPSSRTPLPPTATSTPEPTPSPAPPTATPTPLPPTSTPAYTPAPAVERILFAPGATQTTVEGYLPANSAKVYVMGVAAGQFIEMDATVGTISRGLRFSIIGADGVVVKAMGEAHVQTVVPSTQDYYVELVSDVGAVSYRMSVLIPVRIRFAPGTTSAEIAGSLAAGGMRHYVLRALAGQRMVVAPHAAQGQVGLIISGADGQVLLSGRVGLPGDGYDGSLPTTQDYLISVQAEGGTSADYTLKITIPAEQAESGITIVGTVMDVSPSARIIMLREPVEGFSVIALTEESKLVSADRNEILLRDIRTGMRVQVSGQQGESNALLASQVLVLAN